MSGQLREEDWINPFHGMELHAGFNPNSRGNENGILFLVEYYILKEVLNSLSIHDTYYVLRGIIDNLRAQNPDGTIIPGLYNRGKGESLTIPADRRRTISHDNITAISVMSRYFGLEYHKDIGKYLLKNCMRLDNAYPEKPRWSRIQHPRDCFFWLFNAGGIYKLISYIFFPIFFIANIVTCLSSENGKYSPEAASGKLMMFTRLELGSRYSLLMRFNRFICYNIMKIRYGKSWISKIANIYYVDPEHPIRLVADSLVL